MNTYPHPTNIGLGGMLGWTWTQFAVLYAICLIILAIFFGGRVILRKIKKRKSDKAARIPHWHEPTEKTIHIDFQYMHATYMIPTDWTCRISIFACRHCDKAKLEQALIRNITRAMGRYCEFTFVASPPRLRLNICESNINHERMPCPTGDHDLHVRDFSVTSHAPDPIEPLLRKMAADSFTQGLENAQREKKEKEDAERKSLSDARTAEIYAAAQRYAELQSRAVELARVSRELQSKSEAARAHADEMSARARLSAAEAEERKKADDWLDENPACEDDESYYSLGDDARQEYGLGYDMGHDPDDP